jgi:hypothetical protein
MWTFVQDISEFSTALKELHHSRFATPWFSTDPEDLPAFCEPFHKFRNMMTRRLAGIILLFVTKISALVLIEGRRLNLQHSLALKVCNVHLVHALIPLPELKNVADMVTGTGFVPIFPFLNSHLQV